MLSRKLVLIFQMIFLFFFLDITSLDLNQHYLLNECEVISTLISKEGGLSRKLMEYIEKKEYVFYYYDQNSTMIGEIVYYDLIREVRTILLGKKNIRIHQGVVLGSIT